MCASSNHFIALALTLDIVLKLLMVDEIVIANVSRAEAVGNGASAA